MLSPSLASVSISSQFDIVMDVPPPPVAEVSRGSRDVTAFVRVSNLVTEAGIGGLTPSRFYKTSKHDDSIDVRTPLNVTNSSTIRFVFSRGTAIAGISIESSAN